MKSRYVYTIIALVMLSIAVPYTRYCVTGSEVRILCHDMMYACGDDCPDFKVDSVFKNSRNFNILHKDIDTRFKTAADDQSFYNKLGHCAICFDCYFKGRIRYSVFKQCYVISISEYSLVMRGDCCTEPDPGNTSD